MADEGLKISQMTERAELTGEEYIPLVSGGSNYKAKAKLFGGQAVEELSETVEALGETVSGNTTAIAENAEAIESLEASVAGLQTGYCMASWAEDELDPEPVETVGDKGFLGKWDAYLLDTTDNGGETTKPVGKLKRNNWLRFDDGRFAPTVGITEAMRAECDAELYLDPSQGQKYCGAGEFDAEKFYTEHGMGQKLYTASGEEVGHILRPWETVETKYTIGIGRDDKVYLVDQLTGRSGKVWRGLSSRPIAFDGVDAGAYGLEPTAMSPGPICTVGGKARSFFFVYEGESNCQGSAGTNDLCQAFTGGRTWPRTADMSQIKDMDVARANNSAPDRPYPFAEGGYHALNTFVTAMEVLYGTKYLHSESMFGSGTSSNGNCTDFSSALANGGVRYRNGEGEFKYAKWNAQTDIYADTSGTKYSLSQIANQEAPKWQCLEAQMAASFAVETGMAEGVDFSFYGGTYRYYNVSGAEGLADGEMNAKVVKSVGFAFAGYDADGGSASWNGHAFLRASLIKGMDISGDIYAYWGGGMEAVGTCEHLQDETRTGNKVELYLQPDQRLWAHEETASKADGGSFEFEEYYMKVGESENLGNGYALARMGYTPWKTEKGGNIATGECYYGSDDNYWANALGTRTRLAVRSRGYAYTTTCSGRYLAALSAASSSHRAIGGSAQALIGSAAPPQAE